MLALFAKKSISEKFICFLDEPFPQSAFLPGFMLRITGLIFLLVPVTLHAQLHEGTDFSLAYMRNLHLAFNLPPTFDVSIEISENANITVTFGDPSNPKEIGAHITVLR